MVLRFKYGIHTFFLLVEPSEPFSAIDKKLIEALHERDQPQLATDTHEVPEINARTKKPELDPVTGELVMEWAAADPVDPPSQDEDLKIDYGVLKDMRNVSKGYKNLNIQPDDTPLSRELKDNSELAFIVRRLVDADEPAQFTVKQPIWEAEADEDEDEEPAPKGAGAKGKGKGKGKAVTKSAGYMDVDMDEGDEL